MSARNDAVTGVGMMVDRELTKLGKNACAPSLFLGNVLVRQQTV